MTVECFFHRLELKRTEAVGMHLNYDVTLLPANSQIAPKKYPLRHAYSTHTGEAECDSRRRAGILFGLRYDFEFEH